MHCFERVVSCLLGVGAIAEGKLECGATLCILGVQIVLAASGFTMTRADKSRQMDVGSEVCTGSGNTAPRRCQQDGGQIELGCDAHVQAYRESNAAPHS